MHIEESLLKGRLEKKLFADRLTGTSLIDEMVDMTSDSDVPNRKVYTSTQ